MKFVGSLVAHEASLADGAPLVAGAEYDLSPKEREDPHNARLIAEGQLLASNNTEKAQEDAQGFLKSQEPPEATPPPVLSSPPEPNGGST